MKSVENDMPPAFWASHVLGSTNDAAGQGTSTIFQSSTLH